VCLYLHFYNTPTLDDLYMIFLVYIYNTERISQLNVIKFLFCKLLKKQNELRERDTRKRLIIGFWFNIVVVFIIVV
jgi:hypothetical protein